MQACEGYVENGQFYPVGTLIQSPGRFRAILTVLDEPTLDDETSKRLAAIDKFFDEIESCDEPVPEFERLRFKEKLI